MLARQQKQLLAQGVTGPEGHPWSRPPEVEAEATNRACVLAHTIKVASLPSSSDAHFSGAALCCALLVQGVSVPHRPFPRWYARSLLALHHSLSAGWAVFGEALAGHLTVDDSVYFDGRSWEEAAAFVMRCDRTTELKLDIVFSLLAHHSVQKRIWLRFGRD